MALSEVCLSIGGIDISIKSPRGRFIKRLYSDYSHFLQENNSNIFFEIQLSHPLPVMNDAEILLRRYNGAYALKAEAFEGTIDLKQKQVQVTLPSNILIFNTFLRIFYSVILPECAGFLVHAAGLEKDGKGYLFVGPSSSGKTTTAKNAKHYRVLSDELVIVRRIKERFYLFSTPFAGEFGRKTYNTSAQLKRIFFLHRQDQRRCKKQDILKTTLYLLKNVLFFARDVSSNQKVLSLCRDLASDLNGYRINIAKCKALHSYIDEAN